MRVYDGFTLVEFMVSIAILVLLAGIAAPAMTQLFQNGRLSATANDLFSMVNLARAEAIRRNTRVTLCGLSANNNCLYITGSSVPFETYGWAVFEDTSSGASSMAGATASASQLIRVRGPLPSGVLVRTDFSYATFSPKGLVRMNGSNLGGAVKICDGNASNTACNTDLNVRCVVISSGGSPSIVVPASANAATLNAGSDSQGSNQGCV